MKIVRRIVRVILVCIILILTLLLSASIAIQIPAIQTKVAKFALEKLNSSLNTKIYVDNVNIDFFGKIYLNKVAIKDDRNLDFITGKQLQTSLSIWSIISNPDYINLKEVKLVEPHVQVITYKGDSVSNFIKFVNGFSSDKPKDPNRVFKLDGDFYIKNGKVSIENRNSGNVWLKTYQLQLHVKDFKLKDSDITAKLDNFCFIGERNGEKYRLKNFTGLVHYSKQEIRINNLNLNTDDSSLKGHLVLSYKQPSDMSDFNNKVFWDAQFDRGSAINFKDIRYFTPLFNKNSTAKVYGKVNGTLNNLNFENFEIQGGGTYIGANQLVLTDMMNGALKIKTKNAKVSTSYQQLTSFLPTFIAKKIPDFITRFGLLNYRGDISLDPTTILVSGNAITGLGDADVNAKISNYSSPKFMSYAGTLDAKNLNLRQLTAVKDLGYVSGKFKFNGIGTDPSMMNLDLDGSLRYIDLLNKRYNNITVDGEIKNFAFNGLFDIKDPNLNGTLNGNINFSGKPYQFNFTSNLRQINLDFLGLTKDMRAIVRGDVNGNFSLTNINDFKGNIDIQNLYFQSKRDTIVFDQVALKSSTEGNHKTMEINVPSYINAKLDGNFKVTEILNVVNNSLVHLVPSFKKKNVSPGQKFNFDIYIEQNLLSYFDPSIKIEPETYIKGFIDSDTNALTLDLDTPGIAYGGIELFQSKVNLNTLEETNNLFAKIDSLTVSGITIKDINARSIPKNDTLLVETDFKIGDKSPVNFDLNLYHTLSDKKDYIFGFSPSTIKIDSTNWHINPNNDKKSNRVILNPAKKSFMVQDLVLESDQQHLDISGVFYEKENFNFDANFQDLFLDKIIPKAILGNLELKGIANGKVNVVRTKDKLEPILETTISKLEINKFLLGDLSLNGGYNVNENIFNFDMSLLKENIESLKANGDIINKPTGPELDIYANLDDFHVDFLEGFLQTVFSNIRGTMSGDVHIDGPLKLPNINGDIVAKNLGMTVKFLGVDYIFEGENHLYVSKVGNGQGVIMLDEARLKDTLYNTSGTVNGALLFRNISKWGLNLQFDADNLLVMNTNIKDNELFYGKIFAQGDVLMMGPVEQLGIYGDATVVGNSELTINTGSTTIENESNLVRFVPDQTPINTDPNQVNTPKGMTIDLNINAYPNAQVNLVFDAQTNDKASARGTAENLRFIMNNAGLSLTGVYNIESGTYEFRQIPLIPKDFKVKKGSAVQFSGNPMDATLNISAVFERPVSNVGDYLGIGFSQVYDTELSIDISETLARPQIDFGLSLPTAGSDINSQLQSKFRSNKEEQMIQFSYILLTGKFGDALDISSGVTSTAADIGLSTIAGVLSSIINGVDVDLEYIGGSQQSGTNDKVRYSLTYQINERLRIRGAYGMAVKNQYVENFDGNLDLTYDISKANNGSLVLNAFTKPTTFTIQQFSGGNTMMNQSYGAGIKYNASFNNFKEFIGSQSKEKNRDIEVKSKNITQEIEIDTIKPIEKEVEKDTLDQKPISKSTPLKDKTESKPQRRGLVRIK